MRKDKCSVKAANNIVFFKCPLCETVRSRIAQIECINVAKQIESKRNEIIFGTPNNNNNDDDGGGDAVAATHEMNAIPRYTRLVVAYFGRYAVAMHSIALCALIK